MRSTNHRVRASRLGSASSAVVALVALSVVAVAVMDSAAVPAAASSRQAVRIVGPLHVNGQRIVDATGKRVRFLGVGIVDLAPGRGPSAEETGSTCNGWSKPRRVVYDNVLEWGFNSVRLAISWANLEPQPPIRVGSVEVHVWNQAYLRAVDEAVRELTSRGIAVIIEMSQNGWSPAFERENYPGCPGRGFPAWLYEGTTINTIPEAKIAFFQDRDRVQEGLAAAWQVIAKRYATRALVVGADVMNEPFIDPHDMAPEDTHLEAIYERLGQAVREVNSRMLLIFQDNQNRRLNVRLAPQEPPPFPNVVYEIHLYAERWKNDAADRMKSWNKVARTWNVPLYIGEFNGFGAGKNNKPPKPGWLDSTNSLMSYSKTNHVSWTFWAYWGGTSLIRPGTQEAKPELLRALQRGF